MAMTPTKQLHETRELYVKVHGFWPNIIYMSTVMEEHVVADINANGHIASTLEVLPKDSGEHVARFEVYGMTVIIVPKLKEWYDRHYVMASIPDPAQYVTKRREGAPNK